MYLRTTDGIKVSSRILDRSIPESGGKRGRSPVNVCIIILTGPLIMNDTELKREYVSPSLRPSATNMSKAASIPYDHKSSHEPLKPDTIA